MTNEERVKAIDEVLQCLSLLKDHVTKLFDAEATDCKTPISVLAAEEWDYLINEVVDLAANLEHFRFRCEP